MFRKSTSRLIISSVIIGLIISITALVPNSSYAQTVDISISKTVDKSTPNINNPITYTITVNGDNKETATNIIVTDILPGNLTFISYSATQGTYNNVTGQWLVGNVSKQSSATLLINARVNYGTTCQSITNTASIAYLDQNDTNSTNNTGNATITVQNICSDPALGCGGCTWNCTSNDVTVTDAWLGYGNGTKLGPCDRGGNVTAYVWAQFRNHTGTSRYAIWSCFNLYINGTLIGEICQCSADSIPAGGNVSAMLYGPVTWQCGHNVSLVFLNINWETQSGATCADKPICSSRQAKCYTQEILYVPGPVVADFTSNSPQCYGTAIQFTDTSFGGVSPYSYLWNFGDGVGNSTAGNTTYRYSSPGNYTVTLTVTDSDSPPQSDSKSMTVQAIASADTTITAPSDVCTQSTGHTASVPDAGGNATYNWSVSGQGILTGGNNTRSITWNALSPGTATIAVTVIDRYGCTSSSSVNVTVHALPSSTITAPSDVCTGSTGHSASVPDAGGNATYNWSVSGQGILTSGNNTRSITWNALSPGTATIAVTVIDAYGCTSSSSVNVTVHALPSSTITAPSDVCTQSTGHTASVPDAGGNATYNWSVSGQGVLISGNNTRSITWNALSPGSATISVTVIDRYGCTSSSSVNVGVHGPYSTITTPSSVCTQSTGHTASVPDAGGNATYNWSVSGQGILTSGNNTRSITWNALSPGSATIAVTVTDAYGCTSSSSVNITVYDRPDSSITAPSDVCTGSTGYTASVPDAGGNATYNWSVSGQAILTSGNNTRSITWNALNAGTATIAVTITDAYSCASSSSVNVTVHALPSSSITAPSEVCAQSTGNTASVPDAGGNATYNWNIVGGTITAGNNTRQITWTAGSSPSANISVTVIDAYGCTSSSSVNVTVHALPSSTITAPSDVCTQSTGHTASVPDAGGNATYNWSVSGQGVLTSGNNTRSITWNALSPGTATIAVTVMNGYGCTSSSSVNVTVHALPSSTITAPSDVCAQSTGNSASVPSAGSGATYNWSVTGQAVLTSGNNTRSITWNALSPGNATIAVTVTDAYGCTSSSSINVVVHAIPSSSITTPLDVCAQSTSHSASVPDAGGSATYNWSVSGQAVLTSGNNTRSITWNALNAGTATIAVTVTDAYGCTSSSSVNVTIHKPDSTISTPSGVCAQTTGLTASVPDAGGNATYNWSVTGQGTLTSGQNTRSITWNALSPGNATIAVTITDAYGCSASSNVNIIVRARPNTTITAPADVCTQSIGNTASVPNAGTGATYNWSVTGQGTLSGGQNTRAITWNALNPGSATISVTVTDAYGCSASNSVSVTVHGPDSTITAPSYVPTQSTGNTASVPNAGTGATYNWTVTGQGILTGGQNTRAITWNALSPGSATISVTITDAYGCTSSSSVNVTVQERPTVNTNAATNITSGSATLNGYLVSRGAASSALVSFEWATHAYYTTYGTYNNETAPPQSMVSPGSFSFALASLTPETTYHFRAKAVGNGTGYGSDMQFTTPPLQPPNQPPNVYPIQGALCVNLPVTLQSAPFSDPDPGDTHAASQWQVRTGSGSVVFDSGTDTVDLTSITLSDSELDWGTDYYWRLRHQDNHGLWSAWSMETYFIVADTPTGSDVTVVREATSINFNTVNAGGCTWVSISSANPEGPVPGGFTQVGPFRDVVTTATYAGGVNIGIPYDPSGVPDEGKLRIFHWERYKWVDVTTSIDANSNIVYGRVPSLSWFFIGGQWVWEGEGGPPGWLPGIITTSLTMIDSMLDHFIQGQPPQFYLQRDYEWVSERWTYELTPKGQYLIGAISDIMTYGSILVDWVTQVFADGRIGN